MFNSHHGRFYPDKTLAQAKAEIAHYQDQRPPIQDSKRPDPEIGSSDYLAEARSVCERFKIFAAGTEYVFTPSVVPSRTTVINGRVTDVFSVSPYQVGLRGNLIRTSEFVEAVSKRLSLTPLDKSCLNRMTLPERTARDFISR